MGDQPVTLMFINDGEPEPSNGNKIATIALVGVKNLVKFRRTDETPLKRNKTGVVIGGCSSYFVTTVYRVSSLATPEAKWTFASFPRGRYTKNPPPPRLEQAVGACHQRADLAHPNAHPSREFALFDSQ